MSLETKFKNLKKTIGNFSRAVVADSGGVDITLDLQGYRSGSMNEPLEALDNLDSNGKTA